MWVFDFPGLRKNLLDKGTGRAAELLKQQQNKNKTSPGYSIFNHRNTYLFYFWSKVKREQLFCLFQ
jgi:hypothetical protein